MWLRESISAHTALINVLNPFLDGNGLMREREEEDLRWQTCLSASLYLLFYHTIANCHGGNQLMVRLLKSEYRVSSIKNLAKKLVKYCKICVIYSKKVRTNLGSLTPSTIRVNNYFRHNYSLSHSLSLKFVEKEQQPTIPWAFKIPILLLNFFFHSVVSSVVEFWLGTLIFCFQQLYIKDILGIIINLKTNFYWK